MGKRENGEVLSAQTKSKFFSLYESVSIALSLCDVVGLVSHISSIMLHFSIRYAENSSNHDKKPFAQIRCLYNYNLCKATYKGLDRLQPNKRHFIIARGGFVGVHRYVGLWTGLPDFLNSFTLIDKSTQKLQFEIY